MDDVPLEGSDEVAEDATEGVGEDIAAEDVDVGVEEDNVFEATELVLLEGEDEQPAEANTIAVQSKKGIIRFIIRHSY